MRAWRPATCLFCRIAEGLAPSPREFHSTPFRRGRRRPTLPSVKVENMESIIEKAPRAFPTYTAEEKALLAKKYTAEQLQAIEAGEEAIDARDLAVQGELRGDAFAIRYLDDFSKIRAVIDKPVRSPDSNYDPNLRHKTEDEVLDDYARFFANLDEDVDDDQLGLQFRKFQDESRVTVGRAEAERAPTSYLAPELPKIQDPAVRYAKDDELDADTKRVLRQTGFSHDEIRRFRFRTLVRHRVVNQTRLGKIQSHYCLSVAGDGKGLLGIGEGKSSEPEKARKISTLAAVRSMEPVRRYEERTIYGETQAKVGAAVVRIMSRPPGFGLRAQHNIFEICRCAGISDMAARVSRSRNPMNVAKATMEALKRQKLPDDIARARGKKLVDVRKVYYGNQH